MKKHIDATSQNSDDLRSAIAHANNSFLQLQKNKNQVKSWLSKASQSTQSDIIRDILLLKKIDDTAYKYELYQAIQDSPAYQSLKQERTELRSKTKAVKEWETAWGSTEKATIKKMINYQKSYKQSLEDIQLALEQDNNHWLKLALSGAYEKWIFAIGDDFVTQDIQCTTYEGIPREERPEYVKHNKYLAYDSINILLQLQEVAPDLLKELWIVDQIQQSIHMRKETVEKNVHNKIYSPFTREYTIRDISLRTMITKMYKDNDSVFKDMVAIFELLLEQRHQDGTNSWSFTGTVKENIHNYIQENQHLLGVAYKYTHMAFPYLDQDQLKNLWCFDIESEFWKKLIVACIQSDKGQEMFKDLIAKVQKKWSITSSQLPQSEINKYLKFWTDFIPLQHYAYLKTWETDVDTVREKGCAAYTDTLTYDKTQKEKKTLLLQKATDRVQKLFSSFSPEQRKAYFKKAYDESRWQNHSTWMCSYQEFDEGKLFTVISEHSYWSSSWWIERDSQLDLYTNNKSLQKASTGYQNYRDRFSASKDNYNNQYFEVLNITKENNSFKIETKTWDNDQKTLLMNPKETYHIDMNIMSELPFITQQDKTLLKDALKIIREKK